MNRPKQFILTNPIWNPLDPVRVAVSNRFATWKSYSDGSSGESHLPRIDQPNPTKPCHLHSYLCCICSDLYPDWWRSHDLWQRSSRISIATASPDFNQNQLNLWKSNSIQSGNTLWLMASLGFGWVQVESKSNST